MTSLRIRGGLGRVPYAAAVVLVLAPAALVAQEVEAEGPRPLPELIREALNRPEDPSAWTGLADALPELALSESADPVALFEASRLADSLAGAPVTPASSPAEAPEDTDVTLAAASTAGGFAARLAFLGPVLSRVTPGDLLAWAPWGLVVLLLGATPVLRYAARRKARRAAASAAARGAAEERPDAREHRHWTVTTLAENGLPPSEIARRTGMAQDAVHVLLGLRASPSAPPSRSRDRSAVPAYLSGMAPTLPGAPAVRPPSMGEQAAGIAMARTSLEREARALRGGRLTYGPEA